MAAARTTTIVLTEQQIDRFWSYVDVCGPDECWPWLKSKDRKGYGRFWFGRPRRAHRVAYLITNGRWPTPCGCHSCDFPPCCNPAHISRGTQAENTAARVTRGRSARGDAHGSRTHPERMARGDAHYSRTHPERLARGASHGNTKFSDEVIAAVRLATGSLREIGRRFGMDYGYVSRIKRGKNRS